MCKTMDPMNKHKLQSINELSRFYDVLATDYDMMINFEKRFAQEKPFFRLLIDRYNIAKALDAGCGTGFHSMLLAQLGVDVTATDISDEMLRRTENHARTLGVQVRISKSSFQDLPSHIDEKFDAIFCLGNSLVHLINPIDLEVTLKNFSSLLRLEGILFIQILNYEKILNERNIIQNVKEEGGVTIIREYEYEEKTIRFTIRTIRHDGKIKLENANTVEIRPLIRTDIIPGLYSAGFKDIKTFGSISMIDFVPTNTKDLVIMAKKV